MPTGDRRATGAPRAGEFRAARVGAAAALTAVVVVLLVADVVSADYEVNPVVLVALLGTIVGLLGVEAKNALMGGGK